MGWDAFATKGKEILDVDFTEGFIKDDKLNEVFVEAQCNTRKKCGAVDALLMIGGLDCSACEKVFARFHEADGLKYPYSCHWTAEDVKLFHERIKNLESTDWAEQSVREFVRVCVENNLGIYFT